MEKALVLTANAATISCSGDIGEEVEALLEALEDGEVAGEVGAGGGEEGPL